MAKLLFKMRNVPEDEADEIRELLQQHGISFYETSAGNWGVSLAAIWLNDEGQYSQAKQMITQYQQERVVRMRNNFAALQEEGKVDSIFTRFKRQPIAFLFLIGFVGLVGYISVIPFLNFLK